MTTDQQARTLVDSVTEFFRLLRQGPRELAVAFLALLLLGTPALIPAKDDFPQFAQDWRPWVVLALVALGLALLVAVVWIVSRKVVAPLPSASDTKVPVALKGALAFTPEDGELFARLGRAEEIGRLRGWVLDDQVTLVVVKGESGTGKTSLLRAGLTHALRDDNVPVAYWEASPDDPEAKLFQAVRARWEADAAPAVLDEAFSQEDGRRRVVILDQLEQLSPQSHPGVFEFLARAAAAGRPCPITCIVAFREEFASTWMDVEAEMPRRPELLPLKLFTVAGAEKVVSVLVEESGMEIRRNVVGEILQGVAENGRVSPVDIGIGLLALSELATDKAGTLTLNEFRDAGGQVGLLSAYMERVLDRFPTVRQDVFRALLHLRDPAQPDRRLAAGREDLAGLVKASQRRHFEQAVCYLASPRARVLEEVWEEGPNGATGQRRFRLAHERLIPALERLNGVLLAEAVQARMLLDRRYRSWSHERDNRFLLSGRELRMVLRHRADFHLGENPSEKKVFLEVARKRRKQRVLLALTVMAFVLALGVVGLNRILDSIRAERSANRLEGWRLPRDARDYLGQIEVLELRGLEVSPQFSVDEFEWLRPARNLQRLDLNSSSVGAIKGLPGSLTSLDLSYTGITRLEGLPSSLKSLDLSYTGITSLAGLPGSLESLDLSSTRITSLDGLPSSLKTLDLTRTRIASLEGLPSSLESLVLSGTRITSLEGLPGSLESLDLSFNRGITSLKGLPGSLRSLGLQYTEITSLAGLPSSLKSIDLSNTPITSLAGLPGSLESLNLSGTRIRSLTGLPGSLKSLGLSSTRTSLEGLPSSLTSLDLSGTGISSLEGLPGSLESLDLSFNWSITGVEGLPGSLACLDLSGTGITSLEGLPGSLGSLDLSDTGITSLDGLPGSIESLDLSGTGITSLGGLPDSLTSLKISLKRGASSHSFGHELVIGSAVTTVSSPYLGVTGITSLDGLPGSVTSLDLSGTEITSLERLPTNLEELTLSQGQVSSLNGLPKTVRRLAFVRRD